MSRLLRHLTLLLCLSCMCFVASHAQSPRVDSLLRALPAANDSIRLKLLLEICVDIDIKRPDLGMRYAEAAIRLADSLHSHAALGRAFVHKARSLYVQGSYAQSLDNSFRGLGILERSADRAGQAFALNSVGIVFTDMGRYDSALVYHQRALALRKAVNDRRGIIASYNNIGVCYYRSKRYQEATDVLLEGLAFSGVEVPAEKLFLLNNLGEVHYDQQLYERALLYLMRSLEISHLEGDPRMIARNQHYLGLVYERLGNTTKAIAYVDSSISLARTMGLKPYMRDAAFTMAKLQAGRRNYEQAFAYQTLGQAMTDSLRADEQRRRVAEVENTRKVQSQRAQIDELQQNKDALTRSQWGYIIGLVFAMVALIVGFVANRRLQHANVQLTNQRNEIGKQRDVIVQNNALLLQQKNELTVINQQLDEALASLRKAQEQVVLSEKMASLGAFVNNVAHEFNTPLGAMTALHRLLAEQVPKLVSKLHDFITALDAQQLALFRYLEARTMHPQLELSTQQERQLRQALAQQLIAAGLTAEPAEWARKLQSIGFTQLDENLKQQLQQPEADAVLNYAAELASVYANLRNMERALDRTRKVVFSLRAFDNKPSGQLAPVHLELTASVLQALQSYRPYFGHGVALQTQFDGPCTISGIAEELVMVWSNLIYNAIQAAQPKGVLQVMVHQAQGLAVVQVIDTGSGMAPETMQRIFEPFYSTRPQGEGSGLGLYVSRNIIQRHGGGISVTSEPGRTCFTVTLPLISAGALA